jgi:hypothetical protein
MSKKTARRAAPKPPPAPPPASAERTPSPGAATAAVLCFGLSLAYFLPAFLPGRHIYGTDYLQAGYFFAEFVSQRLADGALPKWVPYIYGGLPLYANPGGTFHPIRLAADLVLPLTWVLPFVYVVHFGAGGFGMFLLTREMGGRSWVAVIAGLAFQFTGVTMSAVQAGHDGRIMVATSVPLLFFLLHRGIRTGSPAAFAGVAATVGFALLSFQIQSSYYMLLAGLAWAVFLLLHLGVAAQPRLLWRRVALGLGAVAFAFLLASVNFLPFLDYVAESPRGAGRGYEFATSWSLPPIELLAVAVPEHAGMLDHYRGTNPFKLHTEYVGALVLVLLVLGARFARRDRYWWLFAGLALLAVSISLGGHTPLYRLYYELLPGTRQFRAPSIAFFVASFALVAMAGITLERMAAERAAGKNGGRAAGTAPAGRLTPWLAPVAALPLIALGIAAAAAGPEPADAAMVAGFARFALFTALVSGSILLWWAGRMPTMAFAAILALVTVVDLGIVGRRFFATVPAPEVTFARDDVAAFLASQPQPSRTWVSPFPSGAEYRGHGNYLMRFRLEQAGGEHGNQLQRYNEFAGAGEDVYVDWDNFVEAPAFLHAANVRHIVTTLDLEIPEDDDGFLREVHRGSAFIYENRDALPRAYLVGHAVATSDTLAALALLRDSAFAPAGSAIIYGAVDHGLHDPTPAGDATVVLHTPDRVVVEARAERPALLVLADNYQRHWRARVDGEPAPILRTNHTFRGVLVGAGRSQVEFEFHPRALYIGFSIYLVCLLGLAVMGGWSVARLRRAAVSDA